MPRIENPPVSLVPAPIGLLPPHSSNFMLALMEAVSKDQNSMSKMQITDAQTTENAVSVENSLYNYWNQQLGFWSGVIAGINPNADNASYYIQQYQDDYNVTSAQGQANESQQDGMVQSGQGQTSTDASNLQMKAQMVQSVNDILSALTNMLGQVVA